MPRGLPLLLLFATLLAGSSSSVAAAQLPPPAGGTTSAAEPAPSLAWAASVDPEQLLAAAKAEPVPTDPEQLLAAAKAAQAKAARLFRDNQFVESAQLLQLAYQYDPRPILLFNAGQAYRKAERAVEAKSLYEQFLAAAPQHALVPETRGYLRDMEALIAMQLRAQQVALALEEQLAAQQSSGKQVALALSRERQRALQIQKTLLQTQEQLARDRQKLSSRRRWLLGLSIGVPLMLGAIVGGLGGGYYYSRSSTDGGTAVIAK